MYKTLEISVLPEAAQSVAVLSINGVTRSEKLPAKIPIEKGQSVVLQVTASGYKAQSRTIEKVDDSTTPVVFSLETDGVKTSNPFRAFLDAIVSLIMKLFRK